MSRIGILSDVHASVAPLREALNMFRRVGVDAIFCAGDIAGYYQELDDTIALLQDDDCQCIIGNHDLQALAEYEQGKGNISDHAADWLRRLPAVIESDIDGKHIYMVHAQPPDGCHGGIKLRDRHGDIIESQRQHWQQKLSGFAADILIVGHTHQVFSGLLGDTLLINPGSTVFNHSCALLQLPQMDVEMLPLSGKAIEMTWNWGEYMLGKRE